MRSPENAEGFPRPYGKYQLLARIGQGGMAEIYRARLPGVHGFEKIVVIKRLLPHFANNKSIVEMFVHEAKLAAEVQHRNVVQIFELGQLENGEYYMAMEHVAGTDLRQLLRAAAMNAMRIPPWFAVHAIAEILDGLAFAHDLKDESGRSRNVIHRDVTPANIFISYLGDIKLGDFGVAKDTSRSSQTRSGQLKGKIPYMSPEQLHGHDLDQRTDVFAAGIVLWECLTQRRLFGGRPDIEAMNLICYGSRKPPSHFATDVPPQLDACVLRALESDPGRRTPSARALQHQLLQVLPLLRPRVLQSDVRHVVEVLLGSSDRDPGPVSEPQPIQDESITRHNFVELTPGPGSSDLLLEGRQALSNDALIDAIETSLDVRRNTSIAMEMRLERPGRSPSGGGDMVHVSHMHSTSDLSPDPFGVGAQDSPSRLPPLVGVETDRGLEHPPSRDELEITEEHSGARVARSPSSNGRPRLREPRAGSPPPRRTGALAVEISGARRPYEGPHPFWVETSLGHPVGPVAYPDALEILRLEAERGAIDGLRISATGKGWMDVADFAILSGQEILLDRYLAKEKPLSRTDFSGGLEPRDGRGPGRLSTVTAILCRLALDRMSGKVTFQSAPDHRWQRREILLSEGRPTFVYANVRELQVPDLIVQKNLLTRDQIHEMLHWVVLEDRPLEEIVHQRTGSDIKPYWSAFMRERLADLFKWTHGTFAFDPQAPLTHTTPFCPSILGLLPDMIYRARTSDQLRESLVRFMDSKFDRSEKFGRAVAEMRLSDAQTQALIPFGGGRTLASALRHGARDERLNLAMAYVLIETELLIRSS